MRNGLLSSWDWEIAARDVRHAWLQAGRYLVHLITNETYRLPKCGVQPHKSELQSVFMNRKRSDRILYGLPYM